MTAPSSQNPPLWAFVQFPFTTPNSSLTIPLHHTRGGAALVPPCPPFEGPKRRRPRPICHDACLDQIRQSAVVLASLFGRQSGAPNFDRDAMPREASPRTFACAGLFQEGSNMTVPLEEQIACVIREIGLREKLYPRWVLAGKMTQARSDREISAMRAVLASLQALQQPPLPLS